MALSTIGTSSSRGGPRVTELSSAFSVCMLIMVVIDEVDVEANDNEDRLDADVDCTAARLSPENGRAAD